MNNEKIQIGEQGIYNASELGAGKVLILGFQHMFAMFGSTVLVPVLTGLSVANTLLFAGLGTLLFHFITKKKVPAFLGSSFAFLAGYFAIAPNGEKELLPYACFGVAIAGLVYLLLAAAFKVFGARKVMKFFPPVVTGPIIIAIGLNLSATAISSCQSNWPVALVAIAIVIICNIWGKGMIKIVPILLGVVGSYLFAALTGAIDFTAVAQAPLFGFPIDYSRTVFSTVDRNFIKDPGLHRTLTGDGLATTLASLFGAPANTTYGENTGVLTLTRVYDPMVIRLAAVLAILFSFFPKFAAIIEVMPSATVGGISLILYGMISAVGVRNVVETNVDFSKSRNVLIAALILVLSIGINYNGAIAFNLGSVSISLSGLAIGSLVGIVMNAILPGKDFEFDEEEPSKTGVNFEMINGETLAEQLSKKKK